MKRFKTPFVIAANKIDRISGYRSIDGPFIESLERQSEMAKRRLDEALYNLMSQLSDRDFDGNRYDRIADFTKEIAIIPVSAKTGEGMPDLIAMLSGLAQRYLEQRLSVEEHGEGIILEKGEEEGLGSTLDVILYNGTLKKGDEILLLGSDGVKKRKIKGIFKPDKRGPLVAVDIIKAAAGVKLVAPDIKDVVSGSPLKVLEEGREDEMERNFEREIELSVDIDDEGIVINADTMGSIEAMVHELKNLGVRVSKVKVGDITKGDLFFASTIKSPLERAILGFGVGVSDDAEEFLKLKKDVKVFTGAVIYSIIDDFEKWRDEIKTKFEEEKKRKLTFPASIKLLPDCIFRVKNPAIVGVRILVGTLNPGANLLRNDGKIVGRIKSIENKGDKQDSVHQGMEVAISIEGPTIGRQIKEGDVLYVDLSAENIRALNKEDLNFDEEEVLDRLKEIKRGESLN